ncbi:MAG: helix-turn-helix domain-containing protein [Elusimicrobiota bacterium]
MESNTNYTTGEIAVIIDVEYKTVARWVDNGSIKGFVTPGGHRRVYKEDLIKFLDENNIKISEKLKKYEKTDD